MAAVRDGKFDEAAQSLAVIETEAIALQAPVSLYYDLSRLQHLLKNRQYPEAMLEEFLSLCQPLCDDYAASKGRMEKSPLADMDAREILRLVKQIQTILACEVFPCDR
jgi:hypothetical protein